MPLHSGAGAGGGPGVEVSKLDDQPRGKPDRERMRELGRRGGLAKRRRSEMRARLSRRLGLESLDGPAETQLEQAQEWCEAHMSMLAAHMGAGLVGPGPGSIVQSAGIQLAGSRWAAQRWAETGDPQWLMMASKLANDQRQNLLAAHELTVREAQARRAAGVDDKSLAAALSEPQKR